MSAFSLYCLLKMDALIVLCGVLSGVLFLSIIIMFIAWGIAASEDEDTTAHKRILRSNSKWIIPLACLFLLVSIFTPSTQQTAAIVVVPKICNAVESNNELMALPGDIVSLASAWIKELRPENIKESAKTVVQQPQAKTAEVVKGK